MVAYADTGFLVSLYLQETTSAAARDALQRNPHWLAWTPTVMLETRNALNLAVNWGRITIAERDAVWRDIETDVANGVLVECQASSNELHAAAQTLSDRYTVTVGTRSLDLLHVAAAILLKTRVFFSFDERQRKAAAGEGLKVIPSTAPVNLE